jgi:hypothetical protein
VNINSLSFKDLNRKKFPGSLDPSEIYSFICLLKKNNIDLVIESGRQYGYSTYFIGKYCNINNIKFYSIDVCFNKNINLKSIKTLSRIKVKYIDGNFFFVIKKILDRFRYKKIALLVDGPKGTRAFCFCYSHLINYNNLKLVFFDNFLDQSNNLFKNFLFKKKNYFGDLKYSLKIRKELIFINSKHRIKAVINDNDFAFFLKNDLNLSYFSLFFCNLNIFYYLIKEKISKVKKKFKFLTNY